MTERRRRQKRESERQRRRRLREEQAAQLEALRRKQIEANERRYPELFRRIRDPDFQKWFKRVTGFPWREHWETDVARMEAMVEYATEISQR